MNRRKSQRLQAEIRLLVNCGFEAVAQHLLMNAAPEPRHGPDDALIPGPLCYC